MLAFDDMHAEVLQPVDDQPPVLEQRGGGDRAGDVLGRCGSRSAIASSSSSRSTTISSRWVSTSRRAARTRKSAEMLSVNSVNRTIIERRVSRAARVVRREGVIGLLAAIVDLGGDALQLGEGGRARHQCRWPAAAANRTRAAPPGRPA